MSFVILRGDESKICDVLCLETVHGRDKHGHNMLRGPPARGEQSQEEPAKTKMHIRQYFNKENVFAQLNQCHWTAYSKRVSAKNMRCTLHRAGTRFRRTHKENFHHIPREKHTRRTGQAVVEEAAFTFSRPAFATK